ncbi:MAG: enoyl-ACP reductase [Clostridia bacterium]|nr:enoyl-ACP reductase [Clostridia bacterium]
MQNLANKNILLMGLRNKSSIAWGIAKCIDAHGARLIISYETDKDEKNVKELTKDFNNPILIKCDVSSDLEIENLFNEIKEKVGVLHGVAHCIAHANKEDMKNNFIYTTREGYSHAMDISAYSLIVVSKYAKDLMIDGGSIVTLSYYGAEKVMAGYNIMGAAKAALEANVKYLANELGPIGIRVNAISPGPIKTISSKVINDFDNIYEVVERKSPLRKSVTPTDVGNAAVFFLSDLSSSVTGVSLFVDNGYNIIGI